jgi:hypothetical protein
MARPFGLRDLALVHRLGDQGTSLHAETALTKRWQPLWGALHSLLAGHDDMTLVWRADKGERAGFVQLQYPEDHAHARLIYLGADPAGSEEQSGTNGSQATSEANHHAPLDETAWLALLDSAVFAAGQKGAHGLIAEADEVGPELVLLRQAGFAVYTRQDIWILDEIPAGLEIPDLLRPYSADDDWEMALLYAHIVPPLIQLVEPSPPDEGIIWVLPEPNNELGAFVHVLEGPAATWLQFFIHPNSQSQSREIVASVLKVSRPQADKPVYCCVRRYQSWLQLALTEIGFSVWGSQAVMVKHTVQPIQQVQPQKAAVLETNYGVPTPPLMRLPPKRVVNKG